MSLEKRGLHRRLGLNQQVSPGYVNEHHHGMWWGLDYTLYTGDRSINSLADVQIGRTFHINPISLMYAVKAEIFLDYTFAGTPDNFSLTLSDCSGTTRQRITTAGVYDSYRWDVSDYFETVLKELCPMGLKSYIKVSNNVVPVTVHGINLRFTIFRNDSFGGYENMVDPLLILDTETNKDYILKCKKESENFRYLSGLPME